MPDLAKLVIRATEQKRAREVQVEEPAARLGEMRARMAIPTMVVANGIIDAFFC